MLKLKPSAKLNRRYLLLRGEKEGIEKAILDYIGILGWAKASPMFVNTSQGIVLAVNRKEMNNVRAAFAVSSEKIDVLKVASTLKGLGK